VVTAHSSIAKNMFGDSLAHLRTTYQHRQTCSYRFRSFIIVSNSLNPHNGSEFQNEVQYFEVILNLILNLKIGFGVNA